MARKKQSEKKETPKAGDIDLGKDIGLTVFQDTKYSSIQNRLPTMIPHLDYILGGGLPFGRMVEVLGKNASGKSTLAVHLTKVCQMVGIPCVWIDVEGTSDPERLSQLGVSFESGGVYMVEPEKKKDKTTGEMVNEPMTIERVAEELEKVTSTFQAAGQPLVIIWDSVSQTPAAREIERGVGDTMPGIAAKALTQFNKMIDPLLKDSQTLFIAINQARDDMDSSWGGIDSSGGNSFKHWASLRLEIQKASQIKEEKENAFGGFGESYVGHIMRVKTIKSKVSTPNQRAETYLMSDTGLDIEENVFRAALAPNKQYGLISGGAWRKYTSLDGSKVQFNSVPKWIDYLKNTEEGHQTLVELFGRMMAISFPNGYSPFKNDDVDIRNIPLYKEIGEDYMNKYNPRKQQETEASSEVDKVETESKDVEELLDQV